MEENPAENPGKEPGSFFERGKLKAKALALAPDRVRDRLCGRLRRVDRWSGRSVPARFMGLTAQTTGQIRYCELLQANQSLPRRNAEANIDRTVNDGSVVPITADHLVVTNWKLRRKKNSANATSRWRCS